MTAPAAQHPPLQARRRVTVVTVHRAQAFSGVAAAGARLARLPEPHSRWRPLAIGADITADGLAHTPLADAPGLEVATWPAGTDPVRQVLAVRHQLRRMDAAVIVPNDLPHAFIAAALDAHRGVRCAAVLHGSYPVADDLYRRCLPLADAWRAVSEPVANRAQDWAAPGVRPGTITLGLEVPRSPPALARPLPPARPLRIIFAGFLDSMNKRAMDLAELADELHGLGAGFLLTIAGDGPARAALERRLAGHAAAGRAVMLGPVPQHAMNALLEAHDVLVLLSRSEGWPLAVMEALALGRPAAITSGCGGATRLVRDGVEGIVVNTGDMRTLATRLAALAHAPQSLVGMSAAAHAAARSHLDLHSLAPGYDAFINEALDRRCDSAASDPVRRAAAVSERWRHILAALETIGDCDPARLAAAWLADLHPFPLALSWEPGALALAETMAPVAEHIVCVTAADAVNTPPHWLGWPIVPVDLLEPGTLVLTRSLEPPGPLPAGVFPLPLRLPGLPGPGVDRFVAAVERLRARGFSRLAVYGAGRHTRRLVRALGATPEVVAVIDDRAGTPGGPPDRLWGLPVLAPHQALARAIDAVIISSDEHEDAMLASAARWASSIPVVPLYQ